MKIDYHFRWSMSKTSPSRNGHFAVVPKCADEPKQKKTSKQQINLSTQWK